MLLKTASDVKNDLDESIDKARMSVSYLVSRSTDELTEGFIVSVTLLIVFLGAIKTYGLPYLYPFIPFDYKEFIKVIFRPNIN